MSNPFKRILHKYLQFKRSDRNAILILSILIVVVVAVNGFLEKLVGNNINETDRARFEEILSSLEKEIDEEESVIPTSLFSFDPNLITEGRLDSLELPDNIKRNLIRYREAGGTFKKKSDVRKLYGMNDSLYTNISLYIVLESPVVKKTTLKKRENEINKGKFDPNNTTMDELRSFGFNEFQSRNLLAYIDNNGTINQREDLLKIYGIDSTFFFEIYANVEIQKKELPKYQISHLPKTTLELNTADSLQLIELNGIGPVFASRIIKYRNLLGGFTSKQQLLEIYNFSEETYNTIEPDIYIDSTRINKIRINFAEYGELLRHPYINRKEAKALCDFRNTQGAFKSKKELLDVEGIDSVLMYKIIPYLNCE